MGDEYLIWSAEHNRWWRAGKRGYTRGLQKAGRYSREEALKICGEAIYTAGHLGHISEVPVRLDDLMDSLPADKIVPWAIWQDEDDF